MGGRKEEEERERMERGRGRVRGRESLSAQRKRGGGRDREIGRHIEELETCHSEKEGDRLVRKGHTEKERGRDMKYSLKHSEDLADSIHHDQRIHGSNPIIGQVFLHESLEF